MLEARAARLEDLGVDVHQRLGVRARRLGHLQGRVDERVDVSIPVSLDVARESWEEKGNAFVAVPTSETEIGVGKLTPALIEECGRCSKSTTRAQQPEKG